MASSLVFITWLQQQSTLISISVNKLSSLRYYWYSFIITFCKKNIFNAQKVFSCTDAQISFTKQVTQIFDPSNAEVHKFTFSKILSECSCFRMFEFFECRLFLISDGYVAVVLCKATESNCQIKLELNLHNCFHSFLL